MMEAYEKIAFLQELIGCFHNLSYWVFDPAMQLQFCTSSDAALLYRYFITKEQPPLFLEHCTGCRTPLTHTNAMHTAWLVAPEKAEERLIRIHALGPFFQDNASAKLCENQLNGLDLSPSGRDELWRVFQTIPLVFSNYFTIYAIMLHYCLTGEPHNITGLPPQILRAPLPSSRLQQERTENMIRRYELERQMIHMIQEGNLDYRTCIKQMMLLPDSYQWETLRQTKNRTYARAGLVAEAAIAGGIDVEIALPLLYHHLQCMEDANTIHELGKACATMEEEFTRLVYRRRTASLSKTVLDCCDYIQQHLEDEELSRPWLAKSLNYSEGYLSRKFRQEMGITIKDYVTQQRLERSKELLKNARMSVQDISAQLHFGSHSHFAATFKKAFGLSPSQWRKTRK